MPFTTLIPPDDLAARLGDPDLAIVDCRFSLDEPPRGRRDYVQMHVPGAVYAHLDEDLSGPVTRGVTGRHPLPDIDVFAARLSSWGIDSRTQVVAYDDKTGAVAARLWWMLRWLGHDAACVLDGGFAGWLAEHRPTRAGTEARPPRTFTPSPRPHLLAGTGDVRARATDPAWRVVDARAADRYRGENETIDPVAGHVPGAISAPFAENLDTAGRFLPPRSLRDRFNRLLGQTPISQTIFYCGSGVTAAHDVLAAAHAGLGDARLYAGSWSEWITDPSRPIAVGPEPMAPTRNESA